MGIWIFLIGFAIVITIGAWELAGLLIKAPLELQLIFLGLGIMIMGGITIEFEKWRKKNK